MSRQEELESYEGEAREESVTTELEDVEVVDFDAPPEITKLMAAEGPPAPDPVEITNQLAGTDLDDLLEGKDAPNAVGNSLAARMTFDNQPKKQPLDPRKRSAQRLPTPQPSMLRRMLRFLFS